MRENIKNFFIHLKNIIIRYFIFFLTCDIPIFVASCFIDFNEVNKVAAEVFGVVLPLLFGTIAMLLYCDDEELI